jgi:hypothetical protein
MGQHYGDQFFAARKAHSSYQGQTQQQSIACPLIHQPIIGNSLPTFYLYITLFMSTTILDNYKLIYVLSASPLAY